MSNITTHKSFAKLSMGLTLILGCTLTYADSPREWGYWDAATAAGPGDAGNDGFSNLAASQSLNNAENNNAGGQLNNEQNATRLGRNINQNQANQLIPQSDYVAYNICYSNCNGQTNNRYHYYYYEAPETAGKLYVNVDKGERLNHRTSYRWYGTNTYENYDASVSVAGSYNGQAISTNDTPATIRTSTHTRRYSRPFEYSNLYVSLDNLDTNFQLDYKHNGISQHAFTSSSLYGKNGSYGYSYVGKPLDATAIAKQFRLGQVYNFSGGSFFGSRVNIAVNFQKAAWKGTWSGTSAYYGTKHNGFSATGNIISDSTLISKTVNGTGPAGIGFVKGGKVDATLVGVINGPNSVKSAIIGKTVVDVQQAVGTKTMGDIFHANTAR